MTQTNDDRTKAGNYFVANYPPFSFWRPEFSDRAGAALERPPRPDTPLGLYVHIPFCRKRCHFCYFKVYTDNRAGEVHAYLDALTAEMDLYAGMPFVGARQVSFVYFGGGTPSYLSTRQLEGLWDRLTARLGWSRAREITFECEPGTLSVNKLHFLADHGVTRLSLGVEHFDPRILELNNRAHDAAAIDRAYGWARQVGFPQINIDLIAGMLGETDDRWARCIEATLAMQPDSVTIYQMEIPHNTTIFKEMRSRGEEVAPIADWPTKRRWVEEAFGALEAAGYRISSAYTAVKAGDRGEPAGSFVYRDSLWRGADLVGLGVASFSHVGGVHFQNHHGRQAYEESVASGRLPIYRALEMTVDERLVREFILQLKLGRLEFARFRARFGVDPAERFREPLEELRSGELVAFDEVGVSLSRRGLLSIDEILPHFYLPEHRGARYS